VLRLPIDETTRHKAHDHKEDDSFYALAHSRYCITFERKGNLATKGTKVQKFCAFCAWRSASAIAHSLNNCG
jgi:hypothetical protein